MFNCNAGQEPLVCGLWSDNLHSCIHLLQYASFCRIPVSCCIRTYHAASQQLHASVYRNVWFERVAMCLIGIGVPFCDIPAYENLLIVARSASHNGTNISRPKHHRPYLRKQDNEEALNSFVAGLVSSILLLGYY